MRYAFGSGVTFQGRVVKLPGSIFLWSGVDFKHLEINAMTAEDT